MEDPVTLIMSFKMGTTYCGEYKFVEFERGCKECKAESID